MRKRGENAIYIYLSAFLFLITLFFVLFFDPKNNFSLFNISFSPILLFFVLFFGVSFSISFTLLRNKRRGILSGLFFTGFLILRFFGFTNIFHTIILLIIIILIDLLLKNKSRKQTKSLNQTNQVS